MSVLRVATKIVLLDKATQYYILKSLDDWSMVPSQTQLHHRRLMAVACTPLLLAIKLEHMLDKGVVVRWATVDTSLLHGYYWVISGVMVMPGQLFVFYFMWRISRMRIISKVHD